MLYEEADSGVSHSGNYTCEFSLDDGDVVSESLQLQVLGTQLILFYFYHDIDAILVYYNLQNNQQILGKCILEADQR